MATRGAANELDPTDRRILRELQKNGRISIVDLADRVGLTQTPCWRRVHALEQRGVIRGYTCLVDPAAAGLEIEALVHVTLEKHAVLAISDFVAELKNIPNVVQCVSLTGQYDAQITVLAPTIAAFEQILMTRLMKIPGVAHLHSTFVLNRLIDRADLPM